MSSTVAVNLKVGPEREKSGVFIHPSAVVSSTASIGRRSSIWCFCQIREHAVIGEDCILGKGVYVDFEVRIGDRVKVQNNVSIYHGVTLEDGVFVGPHVCFTNDKIPRAITPSGRPKGPDDWEVTSIRVLYGASIGAQSVVLPGVTIGRFAMIGSGSVVTKDVPAHALVVGNPGRVVGYVCACGNRLRADVTESGSFTCESCESRA